jgi:LysM domain-containing protein
MKPSTDNEGGASVPRGTSAISRKDGLVQLCVALLLLTSSLGPARAISNSSSTATTLPAPNDDQTKIVYQLRPGEDPSQVARIFHVTVDELLALNHIKDARHLAVGATLEIPDPRGSVLKELQAETASRGQQLAAAQSTIAELESTARTRQTQLSALRAENESLASELIWYRFWRSAVVFSGCTAAALAICLFVIWERVKTEQRRGKLALKQTDMLRAAIEKYRQLSSQFEVKYQNLFHEVAQSPTKQERAHTLQRIYDDDRARLDAIVAEAERTIKKAVVDLESKPATSSYVALTRLFSVRKSS